MCVTAILYRTAQDAPILLASNREELLERASQSPRIQSGKPRVICGIDRKAGGTWLGVNQHGLLVVVSNRRKTYMPAEPRSRGLLCRELLNAADAREASQLAAQELSTGRYAGANYVCLDAQQGFVIYGGDHVEVTEMEPGLHVLTNGSMDDPNDARQQLTRRLLTLHNLDSAVTFLAVASRAFSRKADAEGQWGLVFQKGDYGTVSSTLVSLPHRPQNAVYQYSPGPPSEHEYEDLSPFLRQVLSADRG